VIEKASTGGILSWLFYTKNETFLLARLIAWDADT
jgi:hypothetical protein